MFIHYKTATNHIFFRVKELSECKDLFESFCSYRSTLRERVKLDECEINILEDDLGFLIDRMLGNKKHFYRYDGLKVLLYLSTGYKNEILH